MNGIALTIAQAIIENVLTFCFASSGTPTDRCRRMKNGAKTIHRSTINPGMYSSSIEEAGVRSINPRTIRMIGMTSAIATPMKNLVCALPTLLGFSLIFSMLTLKINRIGMTARIAANAK